MSDYLKEARGFGGDLTAWRRRLHQFPEVGEDLPKTKQFIMDRLAEMGITPKELDKSGLAAVIGEPQNGKCLMLRCDMDALPLREETGLPFASQNGSMHACGHDMHTAMLLGAARILKAHEPELGGCVKLLWQPAEETMTGARLMIDSGVLEDPSVDAAITIHCDCMSDFPLGSVTILGRGITMASNDIYRIEVQGTGCHGAFPDQGADPILAAATICTSLQEILSREVKASDQVVLTQGTFHAGAVPNAIPSTAYMEGTVRTFDKDVRQYVRKRMEEIVSAIGGAYRCRARVIWTGGCQPLWNDPDTCDCVERYVGELLGDGRFVVEGGIAYASEDFANYLENIPGVQLFLVVGSTQNGSQYAMHSPHAVFDDAQLPIGAAALAHVAARWLMEH